MQRNEASLLRVRFLWIGAALAAAFWARELIWQAATQLFFGMLVALAALPVIGFYAVFQKQILKGIADGAVKG